MPKIRLFHQLDFCRLLICFSAMLPESNAPEIISVAICGGSNHILTGLIWDNRMSINPGDSENVMIKSI